MLLEAVGNALGIVFFLVFIVGICALGFLAVIMKYVGLAIAFVLCIGLVSCTIRQSYIKIKSLIKKKDVENVID